MKRRGRWDVESPHILAGSFRADENGCRVSRGKNGKCGGNEVRMQESEDWRSGEMARREWTREESGADQGREGGESEGDRRIYR